MLDVRSTSDRQEARAMYLRVFAIAGAAMLLLGGAGCAAPDSGRRTVQPPNGGDAPQDRAPALLSGTGEAAERVRDDELRDYGLALNAISGFAADVRRAIREGEPVGESLVDRHLVRPEAQKAIADAGLSEQQFRAIARLLEQDDSLRERYRYVAQQVARGPVSPPSTVPQGPSGNIRGESEPGE